MFVKRNSSNLPAPNLDLSTSSLVVQYVQNVTIKEYQVIITIMKKNIFALFSTIEAADKAINHLHNVVGVQKDNLSYVYRNEHGETAEVTGGQVASDTAGEGATEGAKVGAGIGAVVGLLAVAGLAGPLGAVVAAGPVAAALGIGGAVGTVATGAVTGAAIGGLVGALTHLGLGEAKATQYRDRVMDGDILVTIFTDKDEATVASLREHGAMNIEIIEPTI